MSKVKSETEGESVSVLHYNGTKSHGPQLTSAHELFEQLALHFLSKRRTWSVSGDSNVLQISPLLTAMRPIFAELSKVKHRVSRKGGEAQFGF